MPEPRGQHSRIVDGTRVAPVSVDLADAVVQGVRAGFGVLSLALGVILRTLGESPATVPRQAGTRIPVSEVADLLVGTAWEAARLSGRTAATGARIVAPMVGLVLRPPLVPRRLQPAYGMRLVTEQWQRDRPETLRTLGRLSATALPGAVDAVLDQVDVERVASVALDRVDLERVATVALDRVDLERLASVALERLDLERVATVVLDRVDLTRMASIVLERLDLNELAVTLLDQLDLDEVVAQLLNQLDVDAVAVTLLNRVTIDDVVTQLLNQLDLTQLVLDRVDLQRVVDGALDGLDLTAIVVERVDLGGVVSSALQQVDLTGIVMQQVDLGAVVAGALEQVDLTAIVMQQVDLVGVAEYVVEAIDLPEIIRDSTGSVASEAVVGMRMQGIDADAAVGRVVDRILGRRRQHRTDQAQGKLGLPNGPTGPPTGMSG